MPRLYAPIFAVSRLPGWLRGVVGQVLGLFGQRRIQRIAQATGGKTVGEYWRLLAQREEYRADFVTAWREKDLDVLLCPAYGLPALPHGDSYIPTYILCVIWCVHGVGAATDLAPCALYTLLFNLLQYSAGVIPVSVTKEDECTYCDAHSDMISKAAAAALKGAAGLPVGVQVVTLPFQEETCLRVMAEVESGVEFESRHRHKQQIRGTRGTC